MKINESLIILKHRQTEVGNLPGPRLKFLLTNLAKVFLFSLKFFYGV